MALRKGWCSTWSVKHHGRVATAAHVETVVGAALNKLSTEMLFTVESPAASRRSLRASPYQVTVTFLAAGWRGEGSPLVSVISVSSSSCGRRGRVPDSVPKWEGRSITPAPPGKPVLQAGGLFGNPGFHVRPHSCGQSSLGTHFAEQRSGFT